MLDSKKLLPRRSSSTRLSTDTMKNFVVIKTDLVKIDSLLKERLVLSKVRAGIEKQMMQNKKRKEREKELERKKQKAKDGDLKIVDNKGSLDGIIDLVEIKREGFSPTIKRLKDALKNLEPVSYTHLTLPTIYSV